jgi:hypothetical protein
MSKRILFVSGANGLDILMYKICNQLSKVIPLKPYFVSLINRNDHFFLKNSIKKEDILNLSLPNFKDKKLKPNLKFLKSKEEEYDLNLWHIWSIYLLRKKNRFRIKEDCALLYMEKTIAKIESFLDEKKIRYLILFGPAGIPAFLLQKISEKKGVKIIELYNSRLTNRFTIKEGDKGEIKELTKEYEQIKSKILNNEKVNLDKAKKFLSNLIEKKPVPDSKKKYILSFRGKVKLFAYYLNIIIKDMKIPDLTFLVDKIKKKIIYLKTNFHNPNENEKFFFFPLHAQPEVSTLYYGRWHINQDNLIELIARSLPVGYLLYVKENDLYMGKRDLNFLNKIGRHPNIRIISPKKNTFNLISNCSMLFTITGTAGWEALLLNKKVFTFGDVFYNISKNVTNVKDIFNLPELIKKEISYETDQKDNLILLQAMLNISSFGLIRAPGDCNHASLENQNITLLSIKIEQFISKNNG